MFNRLVNGAVYYLPAILPFHLHCSKAALTDTSCSNSREDEGPPWTPPLVLSLFWDSHRCRITRKDVPSHHRVWLIPPAALGESLQSKGKIPKPPGSTTVGQSHILLPSILPAGGDKGIGSAWRTGTPSPNWILIRKMRLINTGGLIS